MFDFYFHAFFLFLYAKVFQDIVMMNDKSLHSGLDIFTGVILGPLVEEWIFRGILWSKLKSYGEGFAILATTILFAIMHGQGLLLIFLLIGFFSGVLVCLTGIVFLFNEYGFNHVIKCRTLFNAFNPAIAL